MPKLVAVLDRLKARDVSQDYTYYGLASPWLQVGAGVQQPGGMWEGRAWVP